MLVIDGLSVSIGSVNILRKVALNLPSGQMAGLIGRNGAGKTTLMRSIMGLLKPKAGKIIFGDNDLTEAPPHGRAKLGLGYMPEDRRLIPDLTVEENVMVPAWALGLPDADRRWNDACNMIPELKKFSRQKAQQLSGGQQKLVAIARALVPGTQLLLLDEPFEGVAPALSKRIAEVVANLKSTGLSIIVSASDLQHSAEMLDIVFRIERGEIGTE